MNSEILKKMKRDYEREKKNQEKCQKLVQRKEELEQNEAVKEYLQICGLLEESDYEKIIAQKKEDMMIKAFNKYRHEITKTNEIYVYLGTYVESMEYDVIHGSRDQRVARTDPNAQYRCYMDLEKYTSLPIPIKQCEEFEKQHNIIFPNTYFTTQYYYELQQEFIIQMIETNQKEAVVHILEKSKSKK